MEMKTPDFIESIGLPSIKAFSVHSAEDVKKQRNITWIIIYLMRLEQFIKAEAV